MNPGQWFIGFVAPELEAVILRIVFRLLLCLAGLVISGWGVYHGYVFVSRVKVAKSDSSEPTETAPEDTPTDAGRSSSSSPPPDAGSEPWEVVGTQSGGLQNHTGPGPSGCTHSRTTRAGSNGWVERITCKDCGFVLTTRKTSPCEPKDNDT